MAIPEKRDPDAAPIACEQCGTMTTIAASHSIIPAYIHAGEVMHFWCPAENHFACSDECAALLAHRCIDEHLVPLHAQLVATARDARPIDPGILLQVPPVATASATPASTIPAPRNPAAALVTCERCDTVTMRGEAHSIDLVYATLGGHGLGAFKCPAENHFGCSQECAVMLAHSCLDEHMRPLHAINAAALQAAKDAAAQAEADALAAMAAAAAQAEAARAAAQEAASQETAARQAAHVAVSTAQATIDASAQQ